MKSANQNDMIQTCTNFTREFHTQWRNLPFPLYFGPTPKCGCGLCHPGTAGFLQKDALNTKSPVSRPPLLGGDAKID